MLVAIMTQPMRAPYCIAYLERMDFPETIVLTGERVALTDHLPPRIEVRVVDNRAVYGEGSRRIWTHTRRALARWSRSGSKLGDLIGRIGRSIEQETRRLPFNPMSLTMGRSEQVTGDLHPIVEQLESIGRTHHIDTIAVFDLFDLPPALDFAQGRDLDVLVR